MNEYFFERGNARASWATAPKDAKWLAVNRSGYGYWYATRPSKLRGMPAWYGVCSSAFFSCYVGGICDDWAELLFQREELISAEEWEHIRFCFPRAKYVAKDSSGAVYGYDTPVTLAIGVWTSDGYCYRLPGLAERFALVDWRQSLVEYVIPVQGGSS